MAACREGCAGSIEALYYCRQYFYCFCCLVDVKSRAIFNDHSIPGQSEAQVVFIIGMFLILVLLISG